MGVWSKTKKIKAAIGGSVVVGIAVIVVPLLYDLYDAGVIKVGDEGDDWNGEAALVCGGNQSMTIGNKQLEAAPELKGAFIKAGGNCRLRIVESTLEAKTVLSVGGNAQVTLVDSKLIGTRHGARLGGNGKLRLIRSRLEGKKAAARLLANGSIEHDAKSRIAGRVHGRKSRVKKVDPLSQNPR
jgi:hypothetical protein